MKTIITILATVIVMFGLYTYAQGDNGIKFLRERFEAGSNSVETFKDTNNGVTCYVVSGLYRGGISCLELTTTNKD
jgi:hypothetical protein